VTLDEVHSAMGASGARVSRAEASTSLALMRMVRMLECDNGKRVYELLPWEEYDRFMSEIMPESSRTRGDSTLPT
jgi:hypothetical protein